MRFTVATAIWSVGMCFGGHDCSLKQLSGEFDDFVAHRENGDLGKQGHAPSRFVPVPARSFVEHGL